VPPARIQALRDLTWTRKQLVREIAWHTLRTQKTLQDANVKVASVLSHILGRSGRAMLAAIVAGEDDPERLAELACRTARRKRAALVAALQCHVTDHHRTMLRLYLDLIAALLVAPRDVNTAVGKALEPISQAAKLLKSMPGIGDIAAHVIVAEIGTDVPRFPTAAHLVSWAGLCPRNDESAGKRRSMRVRESGTGRKTTLVTAA
jgi:transposase